MRTAPPLPVVLCLTSLLDGLFEAVCARFGIFPIRGPLVRFLWRRFARIKLLFGNLAARAAAGKDLSPRTTRTRGAPRRARDDNAFRITRWVNPKYGWLCRVASGTVGASAFAYALREILATDPEMRALLAATPATARILRPLCWMLGVATPSAPAVPLASKRAALSEPAPADEGARHGATAAIPRGGTAPRPTPSDPGEDFVPVVFARAA